MSNDTVVELKDLNFRYAKRLVLENIHLSIYKNDFLAIIGPNGGGKSTLIECILGVHSPETGSIKLFGESPNNTRQKVGYLAQYNPHERHYPITVEEVVQMGCLTNNPLGFFSKSSLNAAENALTKTRGERLIGRQFSELSGGEKQRVLLARSIIQEPKLLILDEPMTGIDPHSELCFYELLQDLNKEMAIVIVSHDISAVSKTVKTVACLNKTLVYHGTKELMPKDIEAAYCCHVDLIAHGTPHRVLEEHKND